MGRKPKPPGYYAARSAINRHLYRHHNGAVGSGELAERLDQHEELHLLCGRLGASLNHTHEIHPAGETDVEAAERILREGEAQDGQTDDTARS